MKNKTFKKTLIALLSIISIGLIIGAIVGAAMGCNYALILLAPAFFTGIYPLVSLSKNIMNKFNLK